MLNEQCNFFTGLPVKPLLYVKRKKVENVSDEDYFSTGSESDQEDKPWFPNQTEAKKQKLEQEKSVDKRFKPGKRKLDNILVAGNDD